MSDLEREVLDALPKDSEHPSRLTVPEPWRSRLERWLTKLDEAIDGMALDEALEVRDEMMAVLMARYDKRRVAPAAHRLLPEPPSAPTDTPPPAPTWRQKLSRQPRQALDVDRAREAAASDVLHALDVSFTERRGRLVAHCPFHEDTRPSMEVDPHKNVWYCFPCATGGDLIDLVRRARRVEFAEAVRFILKEA